MFPVATTLPVAAAAARNGASSGSGSPADHGGADHLHAERVDGREQIVHASRRQTELLAAEHFLVLLSDRHVDDRLDEPGKRSFDDPAGRTSCGQQTGDEDVGVDDDLHPRARRGRARRTRAMRASIPSADRSAVPRARLSRRMARNASSARARRTAVSVSSTVPASTGSNTATGLPLAVSRASRSSASDSRTCFGRVRNSRIVTVFTTRS